MSLGDDPVAALRRTIEGFRATGDAALEPLEGAARGPAAAHPSLRDLGAFSRFGLAKGVLAPLLAAGATHLPSRALRSAAWRLPAL